MPNRVLHDDRVPRAPKVTVLVEDTAIDAARELIAPHIVRTPLIESPALSGALGTSVFCKPELLQRTGSFKARGVFNKALSLSQPERDRGLIAFSAGNHAMAVAHVGTHLGVPVTVCMPAGAVQFKVDAVRALGADLELVDGDLVAHVAQRQEQLGATAVHPFADPAIIAGHASVGREILDDLPDVDVVVVPVGGGGLISGVGAALKRSHPGVRVIGVEPATADVVRRSRQTGAPVALSWPSSLADGLNAPITSEITLAHIDAFVDEMVVVDEESIFAAWQDLLALGKLAGEPSGAVGIAALRTGVISAGPEEKVCLVVSGGNADLDMLCVDN